MDDFGRMGSLMQENERIGRVLLDYSHYQGKDLYSDGEVEDELLDIVQNHSQSEYGRIIEERATWPILYHLSEQRGNIVEWIPMDPNAKVLEVGSGGGAITGTLSAKAREVDCVDLSKKRSLVNAYRNKNCENVTIHVGNFRDIEPALPRDYQYIFLIGVFEYGQAYIGTDHLPAGGSSLPLRTDWDSNILPVARKIIWAAGFPVLKAMRGRMSPEPSPGMRSLKS